MLSKNETDNSMRNKTAIKCKTTVMPKYIQYTKTQKGIKTKRLLSAHQKYKKITSQLKSV